MGTEIGLVDPGVYQRGGVPHEALRWLRAHAPVFWHADGGAPGWPGFWAVTRRAHIEEVSKNPGTFSSSRPLATFAESSGPAIEVQRLIMLNMDPPQHTRQRGFVNRGFTPLMVARLEKHIREICDGLIDDVAVRGAAEFVRDIAAPLPLYVICELMGAPVADRMRLFALSSRLAGFDDPDFRTQPGERAMSAGAEMCTYARELAVQRREQPRGDIITRVGAGNCVTLCDLRVFVDQAAESVSAQNAHTGHFDRRMRTPGGRVLLQRPVRAMRIVVVGVLAEDQPQVPFAGDQHPVQALAAGAAHPSRSRAAPGQGF